MLKRISSFLLLLCLISSAFGQTITVDQNTTYQTWKGWEATAEAGQQYLLPADTPQYPSTSYAQYKAALQSATLDLGIDRLRVELRLDDENSTGYDANGNIAAANDNADANVANLSGFRFERITRTMNDLVIPYREMVQQNNENLYIVLCVVDFRTAGFKAQDTPAEYAEFIYVYVNKFKQDYGILPDAIEAILEPDNQSGDWTEAETANNIVAAKARLDAAGYTGIKWIAPSVTAAPNVLTWYSAMKLANAGVVSAIDEVSYHWYLASDSLATDRATIAADGKTLSMNEWIGADYNRLYDDLTIGRVSSWQQYTLAFPYAGVSDNGAQYFEVNTTTWAVTPYSRTKFLRQFMKFIRQGAQMKGVSNSNANFQGVPFRNKNGAYVVPIRCQTSGTITVAGLPAGEYGIKYTTAANYNVDLSNQTITAGQNVTFTMPAAGVATVYRTTYNQFSTVKWFGNTRPLTN